MSVSVLPLFLAAALLALPQDPVVEATQPFDEWLTALMAEARQHGFSDDLVTQTLAGLEPLPRVIKDDRTQAEFVVGFNQYYRSRVTQAIVRRGRDAAGQHRTLLGRIERAYDVQSRFIVAIWGIETRYGRVTGRTPVFQALATLAWEGRRAAFFRGELFDALSIVSRGHIEASSMSGSWAGAMGQPQFMPSSYLRFAEDFDRDGRRDIWRSTGDALASIANYLKEYGWNDEETWGREVRITSAVRARLDAVTSPRTEGCLAMRNMTERVPLTEWQRLGVRRADGRDLPRSSIPVGLVDTDTRSFLVYSNYDALLRYNCAHYYALTVGLLANQLR